LGKKIVVFSPHPDDETLGCGGTIMKRISEGYEAVIVEMTDGRFAFLDPFGIESDPTPEELKRIRRREVERAVSIMGVRRENLLLWDIEDGSLGNHEEETTERILSIVRDSSLSEVYLPYERDVNSDHRIANRLIRTSMERTDHTPAKYQYSITQRYDRVGPIITTLLHAHVDVDISEFLERKKAAINEFRSQITLFSSRQTRPVVSNVKRFQKRKETFLV
jgi:LmbE family N-acetylglucosaminyl deacetylase